MANVCTPKRLLHRHRRLRAVDVIGLQTRIARASAGNGERSLSGIFRLEGHRDHGSLTGNSASTARPTIAVICDWPTALILAMDEGDDLSVLRQEAAIGDIHQLQHLGVVVQLHRHGIDVLRAGDQQVHSKGVALSSLNGWRIKQETRCAAGVARLPAVERLAEAYRRLTDCGLAPAG